MAQTQDTKARIQYSSRDELDVAVIQYCRGHSRYDLHTRTRSALNGFYAPFAMEAAEVPVQAIRHQALCSIQVLTHQILKIKEQFLPELLNLESALGGREAVHHQESAASGRLPNLGNQIEGSTVPSADSETAEGPVDESLREFLGEDAAIMAGLNPFINDLT
jgi:hypothetical protein